MNILLIEDNDIDRKLAVVVLETDGHVVREHASAEEAIASLSQSRPELILLDMKLPGMNGMRLASQLKANPETSMIPLVAITAFPHRFKKAQVLEAGCDAFLVKPIDTRALAGQIAAIAARTSRAE